MNEKDIIIENGENGADERDVTFNSVFQMLEEVLETLSKQTVRGEAAKLKENACQQIELIQAYNDGLERIYGNKKVNTRFDTIEQEIKELKSIVKEAAMATGGTAKTYAQMTNMPTTVSTEIKAKQQLEQRQQREKWRMEKAKYQVTLSTNEEIKGSLAKMSHKEITEKCQLTIEQAKIPNISTIKLNGVNKLPNHLRLQCKTEEQAKLLEQVDWSKAFNGLTLQKPKYGIVIHGVPKSKVNLSMTTTVPQLQEENKSIPITGILPLRRKPREETTHQSIVIFTEDIDAANYCIRRGFYIDYQYFTAERYCPQLQITQCFKCSNYGHRATQCKREQKCGKCAGNHNTNECTNTEIKCTQCGGKHEVWHHACPARIAESRRLNAVKKASSYLFTT
jgi:hypothetical protein